MPAAPEQQAVIAPTSARRRGSRLYAAAFLSG